MTAARDFQVAMAVETLRDLAVRRDVDCVACGRPDARNVGHWQLGPKIARKVGVPEGKTRVHPYKLCSKCLKKVRRGHRWTKLFIEAAIVARMYGNNVVYLDKDGMPDVEGSIA